MLMLGITSVSQAQVVEDTSKVEEPIDVIDQAIESEKILATERYALLKAEEDPVKRKALFFEGSRNMKASYKKVFEIAKQRPKADAAVRAVVWAYGGLSRDLKKEALSLVTTHHKDNEGVIRVLEIAVARKELSIPDLRGIMDSSKNEKVSQACLVIWANSIDTPDKQSKESLALYKKLRGWPNIEEVNPGLYSLAKMYIEVAEKLSIGQMAPNIVGTDEEGKEFQLKDYQGKVVLLDFWGIW